MPTKTKTKSASPTSPKRLEWFHHYTNRTNPQTFLNATRSAMAVYKPRKKDQTKEQRYQSCASIGNENLKILDDQIKKWMDEVGISENFLKGRLLELTKAKTTKFFADKGVIVSQVDVEDNATQLKAVDMAFKHKGLYAAEKHDHSLSGLAGVIKDLQERNQNDGAGGR